MTTKLGRARAALSRAGARLVSPGLPRRLRSLQLPPGPIVLLLGDAGHIRPGDWLSLGADRIHVLAPPGRERLPGVAWATATSRREVGRYLSTIGPCAAIVDDASADPARQRERWVEFGLHLRPGGWFAVLSLQRAQEWGSGLDVVVEPLGRFVVAEFAASLAAARRAGGHLLLPKQGRHLLKVSEPAAEAILPLREPGLRVTTIATRPARTVQSRLRTVDHGEPVRMPSTPFEAPSLACRHYEGPIEVRSRMVAISGESILPPSFPHGRGTKLRVAVFREAGAFAEFRPAVDPEALEGSYFDLNAGMPGHFGHVLTESLAKLWAWDEARARIPGLRGLYRLPQGAAVPTFEADLFSAFGLSPDDVYWARTDVTVGSYVSAALPWHNARPYFFHPAVQEVWTRLRASLTRSDPSSPARIFVSRDADNRACRNQAEIEEWFARKGFAVVYPERLPLAEQATIFGNARVVAGLAGSAMFNVLFSEHVEKMIVLAHQQYRARNEWMFASVLADELHYFWAPPDLRAGAGVDRVQAFHSTWELDLNRFGAELDAAIG